MSKLRVMAVSSGRADIGIIGPVWRALARLSIIDLHILLTGMHMPDRGAGAAGALPQDGVVHIAGADLGGTGPLDAAVAMAIIQQEAARVISRVGPGLIIAVGDRLDLLPVVVASLPFNVPIAHIGGGDLSYGAIDERIRHALTKLSHLHFVLHREAADRLRRMGEEDWRIHVSGAPNLDTLSEVERLSCDEFAREIGFQHIEGLRLVTVHPETNATDPVSLVPPILAALADVPGPTLFTASNADPGGSEINRRLRDFASSHNWCRYIDTLGGRLYSNALRHASLMVGNSSSGIIEAGLFGLEVLNIGSRQDGRMKGENVHDVPADKAAIMTFLRRPALTPDRQPRRSVYGDGGAAARIAAVLADLPAPSVLLKKQFVDVPLPGGPA